ncbi:CBS domain-containing protein [Bacteriovoracaceae bacterium]|nr:CBS domain-containing protein [Bacteriovoracaceae bacterium]
MMIIMDFNDMRIGQKPDTNHVFFPFGSLLFLAGAGTMLATEDTEMSQMNISIDEYTSPINGVVRGETSFTQIYELMVQERIRHVPVVKDNRPVGIISDRDVKLIKGFEKGLDLKASDIMVEDPYCVQIGTSLDEVAFEMSRRKIGSALVVNDIGELEGIFTSTDGLNALIEILRGQAEE